MGRSPIFKLAVITVACIWNTGPASAQVAQPECVPNLILTTDTEVTSCFRITAVEFSIRPPSLDQTGRPTGERAALAPLVLTKETDAMSPYFSWAAVSGSRFRSLVFTLQGDARFGLPGTIGETITIELDGVGVSTYASDLGRSMGERVDLIYNSITITVEMVHTDGSVQASSFRGGNSTSMGKNDAELASIPLPSPNKNGVARFGELDSGVRFPGNTSSLTGSPYDGFSFVSSWRQLSEAPTALVRTPSSRHTIVKQVDASSTTLMDTAVQGANLEQIEILVEHQTTPSSSSQFASNRIQFRTTLSGVPVLSYRLDLKRVPQGEFDLSEVITVRAAAQTMAVSEIDSGKGLVPGFSWSWPRQ